jgi:malate dehydrogenase
VFAERLGRQRVLGAGAWSDTLRLRAEIAADLGVRRPQVHALMLGQHGDFAVPVWSQLQVHGIDAMQVDALVQRCRAGRTLADFPQEARAHKARKLKPFFTHFTAGRTTEMATAHAVAEIVAAIVTGEQKALAAQVALDGEWLNLRGVVAAPVILSLGGWEHLYPLTLEDDEIAALTEATEAIAAANAAVI